MIGKTLSKRRSAARAAWRDRRVRALVKHAYERVPYYRRLFDTHGVRPERIRGVADLTQIPTTSRRDLAALPASEVVATGYDPERLIEIRTSGSSGMPFTSRRTWMEHRRLHLARARALRGAGLRLGDQIVRIGPVSPGTSRDRRIAGHLLNATGLLRQQRIDTFLPAPRIAERLAAMRPDVIVGTPGVLAMVAEVFDLACAPRMLLAGSEMLTADIRDRIERGFGAPVCDIYGSSEFTLIARECSAGGTMHVCEQGLVLEVLRDDDRPVRQGEVGEVVGTNLHAFAMPLIRYRQGDLVTQGDPVCACGREAATVRGVVGRTLDLFPLPDGRMLHPYELVACFKADLREWVMQYQIVQQAKDHVVLRMVPRADPPAERLRLIEAAARELLGSGVQFDAVITPAIPLEPSGKLRVCRSYVHSIYDSALAVA